MKSLHREALTIDQRLARIHQALFGREEAYEAGPWFEQASAVFEDEIHQESAEDCIYRTARWHPLRHHDLQQQFMWTDKRFVIVPAGRRSGKTEISKRRLVLKAVRGRHARETLYVYAAPTHAQSKRIAWRDLKSLTPPQFMAGKPSESDLTIDLLNGSQIVVIGMDKPERVEGAPIAHIVFDEYADMREESWPNHIRPALADTLGTADFIGVPAGRNHYYSLWLNANSDDTGEWAPFHWVMAEIVAKSEVDAMRRDMDPRTFRTEAEGSFEDWGGRAYYCFELSKHTSRKVEYNPRGDLIFCFDFNVSPGTAVICQEFAPTSLANGNSLTENGRHKTLDELLKEDRFANWKIDTPYTGVIGEIWVKDYSNTPLVCDKLLAKYGEHKGMVYCYGDPAGGARHTQGGRGTDWEIINKILGNAFPGRVRIKVKKKAPSEKARLNSVNSRLVSMDGTLGLRVDPECKELIRDFDGVACDDHGHIDKTDKWRTHLTDALGYYLEHQFPVKSRKGEIGLM